MAKRKTNVQRNVEHVKKEQQNTPPVKQIPKIIPRNKNQDKLIKALENPENHIIFALGSPGSGKTFLIAKYAIQELILGNIERICITRPTVATGENIGFLPGLLEEKMEPWLLPIYDVFMENGGLSKGEIKHLINKGSIEITPFQFMRGRTLKNSVIIADEMQNSDINQLKMLLTRIGEGSKILLTGDLEQSDKTFRGKENGLGDFIQRISSYEGNKSGFEIIRFTDKDIVRHPIIEKVLDIYNN